MVGTSTTTIIQGLKPAMPWQIRDLTIISPWAQEVAELFMGIFSTSFWEFFFTFHETWITRGLQTRTQYLGHLFVVQSIVGFSLKNGKNTFGFLLIFALQ